MTASLGALLFLLSPSAGRNGHVHWYGWAFGISLNVAVVGVLVAFGRPRVGPGSGGAYRAALLGSPPGRRSG